jgi:hypothetical protein
LKKVVIASQAFEVDGHRVTFAAGVKAGKAVVVFGIHTNLEAVPVFTIEREWSCPNAAERYVSRVTIRAAEKMLAFYRAEFLQMTEKVNSAFTRTGFIAPYQPGHRYGKRAN